MNGRLMNRLSCLIIRHNCAANHQEFGIIEESGGSDRPCRPTSRRSRESWSRGPWEYDNDKEDLRWELGSDKELEEVETGGRRTDSGRHGQQKPPDEHGAYPEALVGTGQFPDPGDTMAG